MCTADWAVWLCPLRFETPQQESKSGALLTHVTLGHGAVSTAFVYIMAHVQEMWRALFARPYMYIA